MAGTIKIAGLKFELLDRYEVEAETAQCNHHIDDSLWELSSREVIINPGGEFVRGYGTNFVSVKIANGRRCKKCGVFEADKETEAYVKQYGDKLHRILKERSPRTQTICETLRQIHDETDDKATRAMVEYCLLIAKKMNDKLVEYAGKHYTRTWYDNDGNFIV